MKSFIDINVHTSLDKIGVHSVLSEFMTDFVWRMGESDMQGGYVSGRNEAGVHIQCWTDENPLSFTISFSNSSLDESSKSELVNLIIQHVLPKIGKIEKID